MTIEQQIIQGATGLLALAVSAGIAFVTPRIRAWFAAHTTAKAASMADTVVSGLGTIADAVVQDFNQRVVTEAKAQGTWTPSLAAAVKADALAAVKDQGSQLVKLGQSVVGNMDSLASTLIEKSVAQQKWYAPVSKTVAPASATA